MTPIDPRIQALADKIVAEQFDAAMAVALEKRGDKIERGELSDLMAPAMGEPNGNRCSVWVTKLLRLGVLVPVGR